MKKLRRKIVMGVFLSGAVVFFLTILFTYITLSIQNASDADRMTAYILQNNGTIPEVNEFRQSEKLPHSAGELLQIETLFRLRYFCVYYDDEGAHSNLSNIASVDHEEAITMANSVKRTGKKTGYLEQYRFRVSEDGSLLVFLDDASEIDAVWSLMMVLALIAVFFVLMITLVFWFLSKRIVRPFEVNSKMQKQFITDASHELKTPLAIISANAEVLSFKYGENQWIDNITSQVGRVSEMVNELLTLNRLEEVEEITDTEPVNFSEKINAVVDSFEEVFRRKQVTVTREIRPDLILNGSAAQLERLVSVLVENASKYVSENGEVNITLKKDLRFTYLTVYNTCEIDKEADYTHLFDRFYRPDSSRTSRTGGHGVGLSIAKRIVLLHNGSIESVPSDNGLSFHVKLSNRLKPKKKQ